MSIADEDRASQEEMSSREQEIKNIRQLANQTKRDLIPTGICYNPLCEDYVGPNQLFCDVECSKEYETARR